MVSCVCEGESIATAIPVSCFEFARIDLAVTSLLPNQSFASESERDKFQNSAAVTLPVNLSFLFQSRISRHLIYCIATDI